MQIYEHTPLEFRLDRVLERATRRVARMARMARVGGRFHALATTGRHWSANFRGARGAARPAMTYADANRSGPWPGPTLLHRCPSPTAAPRSTAPTETHCAPL